MGSVASDACGRHQGGGPAPGGWGGSIGNYAVNAAYTNSGTETFSRGPVTSGNIASAGLPAPTPLRLLEHASTTVLITDGGYMNGTGQWIDGVAVSWWLNGAAMPLVYPIPAGSNWPNVNPVTPIPGTNFPLVEVNDTHTSSFLFARHQGLITVGWCDGHASVAPIGMLMQQSTDPLQPGQVYPNLKYWAIEGTGN
jgi:prepilin-type processing-associated H-X9-DG protein